MDLQNIFGLLEELLVDPIIFLGFVIVFKIDKLFDSDHWKKHCDLKYFSGICKTFLDCPFSAIVVKLIHG